ncbi:cell growth-regulating nucleolar protein-like, partial [Agrilus planipennis]
MVVFTCNHCGESVHKPAVEKHYNFACRKYKDLTCVDCFKDFRGEEYSVHTKCLTEDERYAAKGSMPIGVQKKGEAKQDAWVEMIRAIIQEDINMKPQNKNLLLTISKHNNVPRKKQKFLNYIKSATGGKVSENTISDVWDIIESYKEKHVKLNKTKNENDKKEEENHSNSETIKMKNGESGAEKAPKTTKRKDVNDSIEVASPKKKSKTEKLKAAKETETVEVEKNSSEICRVNQKRKENDIDGDNEIKQKKNKTLETN